MKKYQHIVISIMLATGAAQLRSGAQAPEQKTIHQFRPIPSSGSWQGLSRPIPAETIEAERKLSVEFNRLQMSAHSRLRAGDLAGAESAALAATKAAPIIRGRRIGESTVAQLMGDIRRLQGRYQEALRFYLPTLSNTWRSGLDLDIALCYIRTRNYGGARRFYSDNMLLEDRAVTPSDLPGTSTPKSLEASVLMAHGLQSLLTSREEEAVADLDAAGKLAPTNGVIPYWAGMALVYLDRTAEAGPYFRRAARYAHGHIAVDAKQRVAGIESWQKRLEREAAQKKALLSQAK